MIRSDKVPRNLCQIIHGTRVKIIIIEASLSTIADPLLYIAIQAPDLTLICMLLRCQVTRSSVCLWDLLCSLTNTKTFGKALSHRHFLLTED